MLSHLRLISEEVGERGKRQSSEKGAKNAGGTDVNSNFESPPPPPPSPPRPPPPPPVRECKVQMRSDLESCASRYIYVHTLPRRYNADLIRGCKSLDQWMDMCQYTKNLGLGLTIPNSDHVFMQSGWFATNQFWLEVIFHNRMKQYDYLTNDLSQAAAIFVPFYAGLEVARHLWSTDAKVRDDSALELVKWQKRRPEWKHHLGRDYFFVARRITWVITPKIPPRRREIPIYQWDFRRSEDRKDPDWGTRFLYFPEAKNMTALVIESSPWNNNDFGIPYPTSFHPYSDDEVLYWQNNMRKHRRRYLFSFAGAPRPDRPDSIRNQIITQCQNARGKCNLLHCNNWGNKCHKPAELMKVFQSSTFCLQPPGDSYSRRSTFDSILAGCIPVFFHPGSAYIQYLWHFPREFTKYSVFISMYDIRDGKVSIEKVLTRISAQRIAAMREEVISLIPKIVYADPRCRLRTLKDAFDISVKGVLERVGKIKEDMRKGKNDSFAYDERTAWKYRWIGRLQEHEWDSFFSSTFEYHN
ncbi:hypothetical protein Droror1_Dr00002121 [Drosera rotundifolia]